MDGRVLLACLPRRGWQTGFSPFCPPGEALAAVPLGGPAPQSDAILPKLPEFDGPSGEVDDGFELAHYTGNRHRHRVRRWRRVCRRWWHNGHWHRRCRRRPHLMWLWFWT